MPESGRRHNYIVCEKQWQSSTREERDSKGGGWDNHLVFWKTLRRDKSDGGELASLPSLTRNLVTTLAEPSADFTPALSRWMYIIVTVHHQQFTVSNKVVRLPVSELQVIEHVELGFFRELY